jgi:hypothetical protein
VSKTRYVQSLEENFTLFAAAFIAVFVSAFPAALISANISAAAAFPAVSASTFAFIK